MHNVWSVATHPAWTLLPTSFVLSFLSVSLTPSFTGLVFLLTTLLLYVKATQDHHKIRKGLLLWLTLTTAISLSHLGPSISALSTPSISIFSLILLSGLSSATALIPLYLGHHLRSPSYIQSIAFPSLWATTWLAASWMSPIGRLITWTPLSGGYSYRWVTQFLGIAGLDWITGAWASVAAEMLGGLLLGHEGKIQLIDQESGDTEENPPEFKVSPLASILLALTLPSFAMTTLPLPPVSEGTTPLAVACILPEASDAPPFESFLQETRRTASSAKVLLWPEGAVTFDTESEKESALDEIQKITSQSKTWVGVSFQDRFSVTGSTGRERRGRNGMALVGPDGVEMTYYKRKLVPIAESFSQVGSTEPPPIHTIELPPPKPWRKGDWDPSGTRAIPLSASICLDFSQPLTSLDSRPALVLAPAKTWHSGVGRAMYELARARGDEIGAEVLWCDGGSGGLSGVAGNTQVGPGTWVKFIGVPYPFSKDQRRTVYGAGGDWLALATIAGIPAVILASQRNARAIRQAGGSTLSRARVLGNEIVSRIRGVGRRRTIAQSSQNQPSLLD